MSRSTYSTVPKHILKMSDKETAQPVPVLFVTLALKKHFLMFQWNLPCSDLCPLILLLMLSTTEESLALSSLQSPFSY